MKNQQKYAWDWRNIVIKILILLVGIGIGATIAVTFNVFAGAGIMVVTFLVARRYPRPRSKVIWEKGTWPFDVDR